MREVEEHRFIIGKSSFKYNNLLKLKSKIDHGGYYEVTISFIMSDKDGTKGIKYIYILYK